MNRYLTEAEQQQLLRTVKAYRCPLAQRDYHWIKLLIATGARVTEFSLLTLSQAENALASGWLVVNAAQRKGGKKGHEYLVDQVVRECLVALTFLARQEQAPRDGTPAPLIWGREGHALSVRSYQARLKLWVLEAKLDPRTSVHWLRHTRGMNIMRRSRGNNPLKTTQMALGHSSLSSTGVYTQMAREEYARELHQVGGGRMSKGAARKAAAAGQGVQP